MQNQYLFDIRKLLLYFSIAIIILAIPCKYFVELLVGVIVLNFIFHWFYEPGKPLIFLFGYFFVWIFITSGYFYCCFWGGEIRDLLFRPLYSYDNINKAYWLSIIALFFTALGSYIFFKPTKKIKIDLDYINKIDPLKIIVLYILYVLVTSAKEFFRGSGFFQFFVFLYFFKWALFFIMFLTVYVKNRYKWLFWGIFVVELLLGFSGYFSAFKEIIIFFIISYFTLFTIKRKQIIPIILGFIFLYLLFVFWSYVKVDYRMYLSGGKRSQNVEVSKTDALNKLFSYIPEFNSQKFKVGEKALFSRAFYLEYFSAVIRFIPTYKPYTEGKNWSEAFQHVLMPRFFFPNKPVIDDSKHTIELTGIFVATGEQGTSISLGSTAETYADFGPFWMFIPLFLLGLARGLVYFLVIKHSKNTVWGYALAMPMLLLIYLYEKNLVKLIGDFFWYIIVLVLFRQVFMPLFESFILEKSEIKES